MKILLVSEWIAPYQQIASVRWSKIIKYLKLHHHIEQIDVITMDKKVSHSQVGHDELLEKDLKYIDHYYTVPLPPFNRFYFNLASNIKKWRKTQSKEDSTAKNVHHIKKKIYSVLSYFRKTEITASVLRYLYRKVEIDQYDVVITSYGPEWTHLVGCKLNKKYKSLYWIADFRDQWDRVWDGYGKRDSGKRAGRICSRADCLLRVNPYLKLFESSGQKVITIPNGFDPEEKIAPEKPELFRIIYTGTVYISDDFDALFCALRQLIASGEIDSSNLSIEYAGRTENLFTPYVHKYQFESNFVNHGLLSRQESMQLQSRSVLLLMAGWNTSSEKIVWSGKMYEYMMARKPIIYFMAGEEEECEVSKSIGLLGGICYQTCRHEETYPILKKYILEKYQEWKKTGNVSIERDDSYVEQYSYPRIAAQVNQLLKEI